MTARGETLVFSDVDNAGEIPVDPIEVIRDKLVIEGLRYAAENNELAKNGLTSGQKAKRYEVLSGVQNSVS